MFNDIVHMLNVLSKVIQIQYSIYQDYTKYVKIVSIIIVKIISIICCYSANAPKIIGYCWPSQPHRNPASKWYVPTFVYPKSTFPPLCTGTAYMLIGDNLATILINALNRTDFYRSVNYRRLGEDIVFTALSAQIANIPR